MSFSGTPLGQGRRLDHSTFLGKPTSNGTNSLPSYAYGAPALGSRSPPKPTSPSRDRTRAQENEQEEEGDDPALIRFARLKQRESAAELVTRPGGPKVINSPPKPEKWSVKDTSVNIATAFIQAASGDMSSTYSHNNSWASSSRNNLPVPRSTSVEYEASAPSTAHRRLAPPPDKLGRGSTARKPPSKTASLRHVPDSEGEEDANGRGKSPFEHGLNMAKQALGAAAYYVRQRSREPEDLSREQLPATNGHVDGNESSYSYTQEEASFQAAQKRNLASHKKARMSVDNKAYRPSQSDEESSEYSDGGKTKRKKKAKKGPLGGPLSTLPVLSGDKRRKRKGHGSKGNLGGPEDDEADSDGAGETDILSQSAQFRPSVARTSNPPISRTSASRLSREPEYVPDDSMASANQGLDSIPEIAEDLLNVSMEPPVRQSSQQRRARSRTPAPTSQPLSTSFSIGGLLGSIVHIVIKLCLWIFSGLVSVMSMFTFLFGQVFGTTFDIILRRPAGWARGASSLLKYLVPAATILLAWYILQDATLSSYIPSLSFPTRTLPIYHAPDVPPADISEFSERLLRIENALSGLSAETERTKAKTEDGAKSYSDVLGRINSLEGRISSEKKRVMDTEARAQEAVSRTISGVKQEVEVLQSQITMQQKQHEKDKKRLVESGTDEDARAKLRTLEHQLNSMEGGVKEALELGKKALAAVPTALPAPAPAPGVGWWNKLATGSDGKSVLQIKSADGQDVSGLITQLVDSAVSRMNKDGIAKADFALHSAGAIVVPHLTSIQMEVQSGGFVSQIFSLFTGKGQFGFLPPVHALHPDLHTGNCWPFAGQHGLLGVHLARPAYIDEITIDHVAKDVAFDMRTAPKDMEVWGFVEGTDNIARVAAWRAERALRKEVGEQGLEDEPAYPEDLEPGFVRIANLTYDIDAPNNIQTFPVDPEIRNLGVDFGIVQLRVLDNWGRKEYTCLYRFRVHGTPLKDMQLPFAVEDGAEQS